jgi:hypothetical protein
MLSEQDMQRLEGVHPDLQYVVKAMGQCCPLPFMVLEGLRTPEKQAEYVAAGASQTLKSRHLTGHAVDLAPLDKAGNPTWDWSYYYPFAECMKGASAMCQVPVIWGGDWTSFKDGPHWELPETLYPVVPVKSEEPIEV